MEDRFVYSLCTHCYAWGHNKLVADQEIYFQILCGRCLRTSTVCQQTGRKFLKEEVRNNLSRSGLGSYGFRPIAYSFNVNQKRC